MHTINTTFIIHPQVFQNWKKFIKQIYIPLSMDELKFDDVRIQKVLTDEQDQLTYTVQLKTEHESYVKFYQDEIHPRILREMTKVFKESVVTFTTVLQDVHLDD